MKEKGSKILIKSLGLYSHRTINNGRFTSLKGYKTSIFKQIRKISNPTAINVRRISLTHEKLHFLHYSVLGVMYALFDVLGHFSVMLQSWNFCKVEFTFICSARETTRKTHTNTSTFCLLTRIGIIQICEILLLVGMFKRGNFFWLTRYFSITHYKYKLWYDAARDMMIRLFVCFCLFSIYFEWACQDF